MTTQIERVAGVGPHAAQVLKKSGFTTIAKLANATVAQLSEVPGFGGVRAERVINSAKELLAGQASGGTAKKPARTAKSAAPAAEKTAKPAEDSAADKTEKKDKKKKKKKKKKKSKKAK